MVEGCWADIYQNLASALPSDEGDLDAKTTILNCQEKQKLYWTNNGLIVNCSHKKNTDLKCSKFIAIKMQHKVFWLEICILFDLLIGFP